MKIHLFKGYWICKIFHNVKDLYHLDIPEFNRVCKCGRYYKVKDKDHEVWKKKQLELFREHSTF